MWSSHRVSFTWRESVCVTTAVPTWQNHKKRLWSPYLSCLVEPCITLHTTLFLPQTNPSGHVKRETQVPWRNRIHYNFDHMTTKISFVSSHVLNVLNMRHETSDRNLALSLVPGSEAKVSYHLTLGSCPLMTPATREAWTCFLSQS